MGLGNLEEANWRPRITAVENVLHSWRQRVLSFCGKALVINALALSRVVCGVSDPHAHLGSWRACLSYFWLLLSSLKSGHCRFSTSSSHWVSFLLYWCRFHFNALQIFSRPLDFNPEVLPPFYQSLLFAWRALDGSFSVRLSSLMIASSDPHMSAKSCYLYLVSEHQTTPHCVDKFFPTYGPLYGSTTWRTLFFFDLDHEVIDLSWKVAHGVLYTAQRLFSFGMAVPQACFCGSSPESLEHLFFECPLAFSANGVQMGSWLLWMVIVCFFGCNVL